MRGQMPSHHGVFFREQEEQKPCNSRPRARACKRVLHVVYRRVWGLGVVIRRCLGLAVL